MPDLDLAAKVRDYARVRADGRLFRDGEICVSSAWLAREFDVDPRTIAAALRPYGVAPGEVERGVRGYSIAELAGMDLESKRCPTCRVPVTEITRAVGEPTRYGPCGHQGPLGELTTWEDLNPPVEPDVLEGRIPTEASALPDGWPGPGWHDLVDPAAVDDGSLKPCRPIPYDDEPEPDAVARLSAGAGHDMTPALRAAGLL